MYKHAWDKRVEILYTTIIKNDKDMFLKLLDLMYNEYSYYHNIVQKIRFKLIPEKMNEFEQVEVFSGPVFNAIEDALNEPIELPPQEIIYDVINEFSFFIKAYKDIVLYIRGDKCLGMSDEILNELNEYEHVTFTIDEAYGTAKKIEDLLEKVTKKKKEI